MEIQRTVERIGRILEVIRNYLPSQTFQWLADLFEPFTEARPT